MNVTYDAAKNARNIRERGSSFTRVSEFDFTTAAAGPVFRNGELRTQAIGYLEDRLHVLCFQRDAGWHKGDQLSQGEPERRTGMDSLYVDHLIDDDEIPELIEVDFANMVPFSLLPLSLQEKLRAANTATFHLDEETVPVPVSKSVVEGFRAGGADWRDRVDQVLRQWLEQHKAS